MRNAYNHPRGLMCKFGGEHPKGGGLLPEWRVFNRQTVLLPGPPYFIVLRREPAKI